MDRMPAVTNINKKIIIICWLDRPFSKSAGVITFAKTKANVAKTKVKEGFSNSL